jgi:hypothetical protein
MPSTPRARCGAHASDVEAGDEGLHGLGAFEGVDGGRVFDGAQTAVALEHYLTQFGG